MTVLTHLPRSSFTLLVLLGALAVAACGGGDAEGSSLAERAGIHADRGSTLIIDGENHPVPLVSCLVVEGGQRVFAYLDEDHSIGSELAVYGEDEVTLTLETTLGSPTGVDRWETRNPEGVTTTAEGSRGRVVLEGRDRHGVGAREPVEVEFDIRCPSRS